MYDQLSRIDLNLLVAFDVLMQEQNTSRAAERLFISQSAMSKALSRLRAMLDDELFVRQAQGVKPTAKAEALAEPVRTLLASAHGLLFPSDFDPSGLKGVINIGLPEPFAASIVPRLIDILERDAPRVILQSHNIIENYKEQLRSGALDFCIYHDEHWPELKSTQIGCHQVVCMMPKGHPLAALDVLDEQTFYASRRVFYTTPIHSGGDLSGYVEASRNRGEGKPCILETTQMFLAIEVLKSRNAIMIVPPGTRDLSICRGDFVERPVDFRMLDGVNLDLSLIQHPRTLNSPMHKWFAGHVSAVVGEVFPLPCSDPME